MNRKQFLASLVSVLALVGCRCGTQDKDAGATGKSAGKEVFIVSRSADPKTLDPQRQFDEASGDIINNVYDTLLEYHYLKRPYQLSPLLLEKMPVVSEDGLTVKFQLRKGVRFIDDPCFADGKGRELVAKDVLFTLKRFADININTSSWFLLDKAVVGLNAFRENSRQIKSPTEYDSYSVEGLQIDNDYEFTLKLTTKNPAILFAFAVSSLSIIPQEAVVKYGDDFQNHPVGTGPFILHQFVKKDSLELEKNPNYFMTYPTEGEEADNGLGYLEDAGKKLPLVDQVQIKFIPEAQPAVLEFLSGQISWIGLDRDNFIKMVDRDPAGAFKLKPEFADKFKIYKEEGLSAFYLSLNMKDPLIGNNKNLRKALAHSINIPKMIELLLNGRGRKLNSIVPHNIAGSETQIGNFGHEFDLAKARQYLKDAGFPEGKGLPEIELTMQGNSNLHKDNFEFIRSNLAEVGIIVKPDYKTWSAYLNSVDRSDFQIASSGWAADYPDAENFYQLFYGPNRAPGPNHAAFNNDEYNAIYESIRFMPNGPERFEKFKRMSQILQEEVPVIFEHNPIAVGLLQPKVHNFKRNVMASYPLKYLDMD